jgi:hypothetical protein
LSFLLSTPPAHMDMEHCSRGERMPTTNARRIELRDAKMWRRETERQLRLGDHKSRCPCTLCLFGRPLLRSTQAKHLRDYGWHPMKRLQDEVNSLFLTGVFLFRYALVLRYSAQVGIDGVKSAGDATNPNRRFKNVPV